MGHLYRDAKTDEALLEFIKNEWKMSIQIEYEIDRNILNLCDDREKMHSYLKICYQQIVEPMTIEFKNLMVHF